MESTVYTAGGLPANLSAKFSARDVDTVIKIMVRGKSAGHGHVSIEHLQDTGMHLSRVVALFL